MINVRQQKFDPLPLLVLVVFAGVWLGLERPKPRKEALPDEEKEPLWEAI